MKSSLWMGFVFVVIFLAAPWGWAEHTDIDSTTVTRPPAEEMHQPSGISRPEKTEEDQLPVSDEVVREITPDIDALQSINQSFRRSSEIGEQAGE